MFCSVNESVYNSVLKVEVNGSLRSAGWVRGQGERANSIQMQWRLVAEDPESLKLRRNSRRYTDH